MEIVNDSLQSVLTIVYHIWSHLDNSSLYIDYPVESNPLWLHVAKSIGSLMRL